MVSKVGMRAGVISKLGLDMVRERTNIQRSKYILGLWN